MCESMAGLKVVCLSVFVRRLCRDKAAIFRSSAVVVARHGAELVDAEGADVLADARACTKRNDPGESSTIASAIRPMIGSSHMRANAQMARSIRRLIYG